MISYITVFTFTMIGIIVMEQRFSGLKYLDNSNKLKLPSQT